MKGTVKQFMIICRKKVYFKKFAYYEIGEILRTFLYMFKKNELKY